MTRQEIINKIKNSSMFQKIAKDEQEKILEKADPQLASYLGALVMAEADSMNVKKDFVTSMGKADADMKVDFKKAGDATRKNIEASVAKSDEEEANKLINTI